MMVHTLTASTQEGEAVLVSIAGGHPGLHDETRMRKREREREERGREREREIG